MEIFAGFLIIFINVLTAIYNHRWGLCLYLILAFISPNIMIYNKIVSYEILCFPFIFLILLFRLKSRLFFCLIDKKHKYLTLYYLVLIISTIFSIATNTGQFRGIIPAFGVARIFIIVVLCYHILDKKHIKLVLSAIIISNLIVITYQIAVPSSVNLFYQWYFKESLTPLASQLQVGYFTRPTGTFASPVSLGVFCLLAFGWKLGVLFKKGLNFISLFEVLAIIFCSLLSMSKTAIFGVPILYTIGVMIYFIKSKKRITIMKLFALFLVLGLSTCVWLSSINVARMQNFSINHYLALAERPSEIFSSRYDANRVSYELMENINIFLENPIFGVGLTQVRDEFLGDSLYISLLHDSGVLGCCLFICFISVAFRKMWQKRSIPGILVIVSFILSGLALPTLISLFAVIGIGFPLVLYRRDEKIFDGSMRSNSVLKIKRRNVCVS